MADAKKRIEGEIGFKYDGKGVREAIKSIGGLIQNYDLIKAKIVSVGKKIMELTDETDTYITSQKVLNTTFGNGVKNINTYASKLNEMAGISRTDISKQTALFGQMSNSLGMSAEYASRFSIALTDMSAQLSMLYNIDFNTMATSLLNVSKGASKTFTSLTGMVIKEQQLKETLVNIGLDKQISELNGAEKAMLQYITIVNNLNVSNKELQDTVNGVAWQKKMLTNQVKQLYNAIGNLLYPILKVILPPLNAILMVVTNLINVFARLIGYKGELSASLGATANNIKNVGEEAQKASKKINSGTRSFDKLNNITTPDTSSGAGGIGGGISPEMLKAFADAEKKMLEIRNKATEIADTIMKWLGFTKGANDEWEFTNLTLGTIIGALGGVLAITKVIKTAIGGLKWVKALFSLGNTKASDVTKMAGDTSKSVKSFELPSTKTIIQGLKDMAIIIGGAVALMVAIGLFMQIPNIETITKDGINIVVETFTGLGKVIFPIAAIATGSAILGNIGKSVYTGMGELAVIIAATPVLMAAIGELLSSDGAESAISGIDIVVKVFEGIGKILIPLAGLSGLSALVGCGSEVIIPGLGILAVIITATTVFFAAVGKLDAILSGGLTKYVEDGGELLAKVAYSLGKFAGSIVGGLGAGISSGFPEIGTNLAGFAENAKPFFEATGSETFAQSCEGVKYLAEALLVLTKENLISSLTSWLVGKASLVTFGVQIANFAPYFKTYADTIGDVNGETVESSAKAALSLAELANKLPSKGGKWQEWFGTNTSLASFGAQLPKFGENLAEYSDKVKNIKGDVVTNSANAAMSIAELANKLPKDDGLWQTWFGSKGLDSFGTKLASFGTSFKTYFETVNDIGVEKLNTVTRALSDIVNNYKTIKDNDLTYTVTKFGNALKSSANDIKKFYSDSFKKSDAESIGSTFGKALGQKMSSAFKSNFKATISIKDGKTELKGLKLSAYANGGFPEDGLFMANHNELVGKFSNGKTAVANNDQIIKGIENGVANAMIKASKYMVNDNGSPTIIVKLGDEEITDFITTKQKQRDRQYGF